MRQTPMQRWVSKARYFVMRPLYLLGRWLMHTSYVGNDCVEHDLRLQVQEMRRELSRMKQRAIRAELARDRS